MNPGNAGLVDLIGVFVGLIFSLAIFSYLLGDNVLFRIVIHIFIGVTAGYTAVIVIYSVIWPQLLIPLLSGSSDERLFAAIPFLLSILVLTKISPRFSSLGNPAMAFLVGVGAAVAVSGAILGTLFPQALASINLFDLESARQVGTPFLWMIIEGSVILIGTLTTLVYFHFGARTQLGRPTRRAEWIETLAWIGQLFIAITFGVLFFGVFSAALTAFIERMSFFINFLRGFLL